MDTLGDRITLQLNKKGMTQKQLAEAAQTTNATISRYLAGLRDPSPSILIKIADVLDVSTDYLLGRTENPAPVDEIAAASVANGGTYTDLTPENLEAIEQLKVWLRNMPELKKEE